MTSDLRLAVPAVLVWLVAALAARLPAGTALGAGTAVVLLATALGTVSWRRRHRPGARGGALLAIACGGGVLLSSGAHAVPGDWIGDRARSGASVVAEAGVRGVPLPLDGAGPPRYLVAVELRYLESGGVGQAVRGPAVVVGGSAWPDLGYGTVVRVEGRLSDRDGDAFLRADGEPTVLSGPSPAVVGRIHTALLDVTEGLSPQARGLVPGIAVGDTTRLGAELDDAMRTTSLTHITAVSGGHFAIIVSTVALVIARAPRPVRALVTAAVMVGFVVLVHPQPSVLRAAGMGAVGVVAMWWGRPSRVVPALGTAVIGLLIVDPALALSYGFVLSVLATAGLALGAPALARRIAPWCGRTIAPSLAVPIAAQAAVAPVLILLDPAVGIYAVPANFLAAPALGPATVLGVGAALLAPIWPPGALLMAQAAGVCTGWIAGVARVLADLPGASLPWPSGPRGAILLAVVTLVVTVLVARRPRTERPPLDVRAALGALGPVRIGAWGAGVAALGATVLWGVPGLVRWTHAPPDDWAVAACDVGQGDALAIRTGPTSAMVVDAGPDSGAVDECLAVLGVETIDLVAFTHYHADHVAGLPGALRRPVAGALLPGPAGQPAAARDRVLGEFEAAGVEVVTALDGMAGTTGEARWEVLQAADPLSSPARDGDESTANDTGVVLRIEVSGLSVVVLGDLEERGQARLAARAGPTDVVKVAHHGSASQSDRLAEVLAPRLALVSVGDNAYGHPTEAALDLYEGVGADIRRTDECGTITLHPRAGGIAVGGCE